MADPATLAMISIGSSAAGGIVGAFGKQAEGKATSDMYNYQAGVAQLNQKIALQNRDYASAAGEKEALRYGMKAAQMAGTIKTTQAAGNLDVNSGSAQQVQESAHEVAKMDMGTIRANAARQAYGYSVEAFQQGEQATLYGMAARNAKQAGNINALSSLLSGASSVASKWSSAKTSGAF